ncbi:MAG: haloacid dehalogenase-like hydrolase [Proteobacteria bacterium]|nr:haloacid dehalogenase-like hydrolase [Pseudomonadota bacterium]
MQQSEILYLFDIDGTLLLSGGAGAQALDQVLERRYGIRGAMASISPAGKTDLLILGEIFARHLDRAPEPGEVTTILAEYVPCLRATLAAATRFRLMPAVVEILDFLAGEPGVHLGVATGNSEGGARAKLEHAGLWHRFALGGYGDDVSDRAVLVERAIERGHRHIGRSIARERIVVIGDTLRDVRAARACGVRAVAVATGSVDRATLENSNADAVFDTLAELPAWHHRELKGR